MLKFQGNAYSFSYKILINGTLITFLKVKKIKYEVYVNINYNHDRIKSKCVKYNFIFLCVSLLRSKIHNILY